MLLTRKSLVVFAVLAVLISGTCIYFSSQADDSTSAAVADERPVSKVVVDPPVDDHLDAVQATVEEAAWWRAAARNEWNAAVARNEAARQEAIRQAELAKRQTPRLRTAERTARAGGTYAGNPTGSVNGYPCGGDLPPCYVLKRESGGNPGAENPVSSASGLWQFIDGTWNGFGGYSHASDAPPEVQNEKARQTWAGGAGAGHWACC